MSTITALTPTLFSAARKVAGEPFGAVGAIRADFDSKAVAYGDKVTVPVATAGSNATFTPGNVAPAGGDRTAEAITVEISKMKQQSLVLTAEQMRSLENGGNMMWVEDWAGNAMRALRNEMEQDCVAAIKQGASRAVGTAGTTPFASSLDLMADVRTLLRANGAPMADPQGILSAEAANNISKLAVFVNAANAGSDAERRSGILGRQYGFQLRDSAGISAHTKGTATGFDVNLGAGYAVGDRTIAVDGSDSGTILAGDIVTWAGDANKYVVESATASGAASGNIVLGRPGLRATLADTVEGTIGGNYTPNLFFERSAVVGVIRPPLMPANPTIQQRIVTDPMGMSYLFLDVSQWGQRSFFLLAAWGFKVIQSEFVGIILG